VRVNYITALDISLTATGVAKSMDSAPDVFLGTICPDKRFSGIERIDLMLKNITRHSEGASLVVIEGLSFGHNLPSAQERAGLHWMVRYWLWKQAIEAVLVAPTQLKKFVTGKGSAEKSVMLREVFRQWNISADNDNEADAYGLYRIGLCLLGEEPRTQAQRDVIATLRKSQKMPAVAMAEASW
jgi:crossover junction endodeoxyribonuclease RuvC